MLGSRWSSGSCGWRDARGSPFTPLVLNGLRVRAAHVACAHGVHARADRHAGGFIPVSEDALFRCALNASMMLNAASHATVCANI